MIFTQQFIVRNKHLGSALRNFVRCHETWAAPSSYAYFCPVCAELWARCPVVDNQSGKLIPFQVLSVECEQHHRPTSLTIPGTLHLTWDKDFTKAFPDTVFVYEFNQALKLYKDTP
jgi:hypothetical protein